ncbi:hypothetical protein AMTRI_Chr07g75910 [Amborella trichopoda]
MASKPGPLTDWPWKKLGNFKYMVIVPCAIHAVYRIYGAQKQKRDHATIISLGLFLSRIIHDQLWITLSRFQTARSKHRIQSRGIDFEQVDRERNWDDQAILHAIIFYIGELFLPGAQNLPLWNTKGVIIAVLCHAGPVEYIYYWAHRALHHHFLYTRYHSHHHSSFVTEPITSVVHPFAEHILYALIFAVPFLATVLTYTASYTVLIGYMTFIDFMNNMGHCNFEFFPKWTFKIFPPLKYLIYTPSYHSLHHSQVHTNFSLFMPIYDYMYNTVDKTTDSVYESSIEGREDTTDVVHLTHPTSLHSIYHLRLGFAYLAAEPYSSKWYLWLMCPLSFVLMLVTWIFGCTFVVEKNKLYEHKMQTWAIPRYNFQYSLKWQKAPINNMIEKAILEADAMGVKVISLGLLNQGEEFNKNGELYLHNREKLKTRIVDGSTLSAATVLNGIPHGTQKVLIRGCLTKTLFTTALALLERRTKIVVIRTEEYENLKMRIPSKYQSGISLSNNYDTKVWLVGEDLRAEEQSRANRGTLFIPFTQFPPRAVREDCIYHTTPALVIPRTLEDVHSCEDWLPRRVMSAWRVAGIVHALEGWDSHECGNMTLDVEKVWSTTLSHGFKPINNVKFN